MAKNQPKWTQWAKIIKERKLQKLNPHDPKRQEKIDLIKEETIREHREEHGIPPTAAFLTESYLTLREAIEAREKEIKNLELELDALTQMTEAQFEAEGIQRIKLEDGSALGLYPEPYAVVVDPEKLKNWAIKNGLGSKLALPWQTTNSELKEALANGAPEPDGVETLWINKIRRA